MYNWAARGVHTGFYIIAFFFKNGQYGVLVVPKPNSCLFLSLFIYLALLGRSFQCVMVSVQCPLSSTSTVTCRAVFFSECDPKMIHRSMPSTKKKTPNTTRNILAEHRGMISKKTSESCRSIISYSSSPREREREQQLKPMERVNPISGETISGTRPDDESTKGITYSRQ